MQIAVGSCSASVKDEFVCASRDVRASRNTFSVLVVSNCLSGFFDAICACGL